MKCEKCGKSLAEDEVYGRGREILCESCLMELEPVCRGHTGPMRDRVSADRRRLTVWWAEKQ